MLLHEALERHARERPAHPALEARNGAVTYADLVARVRLATRNLSMRGVKTGEPVHLDRADTGPTAVAMLALARIGAPVVFDGTGGAEEIPGRPHVHHLVSDEAPGNAALRFRDLIRKPGNEAPVVDLPLPDPGTGIMLLTTSGTTGRPKSFLFTHDQVFARCRQLERNLGLGPGDRVFLEPGVTTAVGRRMLLNMLAIGATLVLPGSTNRTRMVELMREKRVSFALLTPAHLSLFMRNEPPVSPALPETVIGVTSSPLLAEVHDAAATKLTPHLHDIYGTNETGILTLTGPGDRRERPGTVGRAAAGVSLEVVDEEGHPVPAGTVGAIRCRAEGYPDAYLGDTDATGRCFRDGWFHPGDLGVLDEAGYLFLRGRTDDVINNQGVKFYPIELEEVLRRHPEILDVAVVGVQDDSFHEFATALVVARRRFPLQELWVLQRALPSPMRALWIFFVDDLGRSPSGKLPRGPLRRLARALIEQKKKEDPH